MKSAENHIGFPNCAVVMCGNPVAAEYINAVLSLLLDYHNNNKENNYVTRKITVLTHFHRRCFKAHFTG